MTASPIVDTITDQLATLGVHRLYVGSTLGTPGLAEAAGRAGLEHVVLAGAESPALAAAGESLTSGGLTACIGTRGGAPGFLDGVADIRHDGPVIAVLATSAGDPHFSAEKFVSEHAIPVATVSDPAETAPTLRLAAATALARRATVLVRLPEGALGGGDGHTGTHPHPVPTIPTAHRILDAPAGDRPDLDAMTRIIDSSRRVTIVAGDATSEAHDQVIDLARTLQAPVAHTLRGKENVEWGNPYDVGLVGRHGAASARRAIADSDAVIVLGTDLPPDQTLPLSARIVRLSGQQRLPRILSVWAETVGQRTDKDRLDGLTGLFRAERTGRAMLKPPTLSGISALEVIGQLDRLAQPDAIIAADLGPWHAALGGLGMNGSRRLIGTLRENSLADAAARAIGAARAEPGRQVIALVGDRGLRHVERELEQLTLRDDSLTVVALGDRGVADHAAMPSALAAALGGRGPRLVRFALTPGITPTNTPAASSLRSHRIPSLLSLS
ncbi:hypothetical protein N1031_06005 [Herbiconiux moechotypicola]|uniref:Ubiquinone-dependent pyruvate dehydrogenase n=1 Tax=Herbiconiux moechotypicola TaxID=637393 RepID=A0ABN3DEF1_9MICO|nr:hypothetical protein [Herbiconiux moechotypicola]MCS5729309.1 hypothetical protein [Herbiconiux moechotypicola]